MSKLARFARTQGARDKKKRRSRMLRNIAIGLGGTALLGGAAYLGRGKIAGLMGKGKPPAATGGGSPRPPAPKPPSSGGGGSPQRPDPKPPSSGGGGSPQRPDPKPPSSGGGGSPRPPAPKPPSSGGGGSPQRPALKAAEEEAIAKRKNKMPKGHRDLNSPQHLRAMDPVVQDQRMDRKNYYEKVNDPELQHRREKIIQNYKKHKRYKANRLIERYGKKSTKYDRFLAKRLLILANFSCYEPTMMSLANFNRKWT